MDRDSTAYSVFYQTLDDQIGERWSQSSGVWVEGPSLSNNDLPKDAKENLASLTLVEKGDVYQFLLSQDPSTGTINFYHRFVTKSLATSTNWKGPSSSDALRFSRKDSQIACLTPDDNVALNYTIPEIPEFAKCFFQLEGGQVRQVSVDYTGKWQVDRDILL